MKQIYRILFIILAIVFIFITASIFVLFITHTCCEPSVCVPCLGIAKIQEIIRQFAGIAIATLLIPAVVLSMGTAIDNIINTQSNANLVLMKTRLNN